MTRKSNRIEELRGQGLTRLQAEIQVAQEDADARMAQLRAREAREEKAVREIILTLLEDEHTTVYTTLRSRAVEMREAGITARSARARKSRTTQAPEVSQSSESESTAVGAYSY